MASGDDPQHRPAPVPYQAPTMEPYRAPDHHGPGPADPAGDVDESRMPFTDHLRELRDRLRNSILALIVGFGVSYAIVEDIFRWLARPLFVAWQTAREANPMLGEATFHFASLIEPFWTYLSVAFWSGIFVASPVIFLQIWSFIAPGLYKNEKKVAFPFAFFSAICFAGGAAFCYVYVLPVVYGFLLGFSSADIGGVLTDLTREVGANAADAPGFSLKPTLFMKEYLALAKKLMIGFGLVFELPLAIFFLSAIGAVTHRGLWRFNRWWIVLSFIVAALLTPPDIISQTLMAGPLVVLYNVSIVIAWLVTRSKERKLAALAQDDDADDDDDGDSAKNSAKSDSAND